MPPAKRSDKKSAKSARKTVGRPFEPGEDARRGRGPKPGAPNAGRPPDKIRETCRAAFDKRIAILTKIADDKSEPAPVRMKAIETLAKYGLGTTTDSTVRISRQDLEKMTDAELEALAAGR